MNAIQLTHEGTGNRATFANVCLNQCRHLIAQIKKTKDAIRAQFRHKLEGHEQLLRLALNEAEAIAWQSEFPHLVFPTLAMEKAEAVAAWHIRQSSMHRAVSRLAFAA